MSKFNSLSEEISEDIKWRELELSRIKRDLTKLNSLISEQEKSVFTLDSDPHKKNELRSEYLYLSRLALPIIYSHWEGYVKFVFRCYVIYINSTEVLNSELSCNLKVMSLNNLLDRLKGKGTHENKIEFINKYDDALNEKVNLVKNVNTKSNLNFDTLNELFINYSFNVDDVEINKSVINNIVNVRNRISHGENSAMTDFPTIIEYINFVIGSMGEFLVSFEMNVNNKNYLHS